MFRSAQFFTSDHRLLVATLKLRLRCPRRATSGQVRLDVGRLRDPDVAQAYATGLAEALGEPDATEGPEAVWSVFKSTTLDVAGVCIPRPPRKIEEGISQETIDIIEECRRARLDGETGRHRELRRDAVRAMRGDQESRIQGICESVESHLYTGDARPAYKALRKLRSSASTPRCPTVRAADGAILSDEPAVKARWAGY